MTETLKGCPFCGSHSVNVCRTNKNACWIQCEDCGADAESCKTRTGAFKNWNRRYYDDVPATIIYDDEDSG